MSFFIEENGTLLGDVNTDLVKFESSVDSRNPHCRTNSRDSTSETARERKDRALRERSPVIAFSRNLSLMMRMRALIDGQWSAMRAMLLAVLIIITPRLRMRRAGFSNRFCLSVSRQKILKSVLFMRTVYSFKERIYFLAGFVHIALLGSAI